MRYFGIFARLRVCAAAAPALAVLLMTACLCEREIAQEIFCLLIPLEQTVSRDELAQRYYTRTVREVWYCGSDERYDHFTLFGRRYAVPRNEESLPGNLRFPIDEKREKIPLRLQPISGEFQPIPAGE